jgi:hypothetical protein
VKAYSSQSAGFTGIAARKASSSSMSSRAAGQIPATIFLSLAPASVSRSLIVAPAS